NYLNNPAKKGKLLVFVGAHAGPDHKMSKTGLEPLLAELNVELGKQFLYHLPIEFKLRPDHILAAFTTASRQNPIRQSIARFSRYIQFGSPREVNAIATNPTFQST